MEIVKLNATKRAENGKKATKATRVENLVPCNMYGGAENTSFAVEYNALKKGIYTDQFIVFELNIDGKATKAIVKEIQFHPTKDSMLHVDFQELVPGKKLKTEIPLRTKGFSKGQQAGGKLEIKLRKIKIKADADNIPSFIEIDVTPLELGKSLRVRDIIVNNYEILNSPAIPIVTISIPRALRSAQASQGK
jgi:large subunit ribosomal protein L25